MLWRFTTCEIFIVLRSPPSVSTLRVEPPPPLFGERAVPWSGHRGGGKRVIGFSLFDTIRPERMGLDGNRKHRRRRLLDDAAALIRHRLRGWLRGDQFAGL